MIYALTLRTEQIAALNNIVTEISAIDARINDGKAKRGGSPLMRKLRREIRLFALERGAEHLRESSKLAEVFGPAGNLPKAHTEMSALLADFFVFRFRKKFTVWPSYKDIQGYSKADAENLDQRVRAFHSQIKKSVSVMKNPFSQLALELPETNNNEEIPSGYYGDFVGYRRSSNEADVIRFIFSIRPKGGEGSRFVTYENQYIRGEKPITVEGGGVFADGALYLFGHANDRNGSNGYRVQALQKLGDSSEVLLGPVLSKDEHGPISARIVLIPYKNHTWTKRQRSMRKERRLADLIAKPTNSTIRRYISDIKENTRKCFGELGEDGLFHYISNLTDTVVKANPGNKNSVITSEIIKRKRLHDLICERLDAREEIEPGDYRRALEYQLAKDWQVDEHPG